MPTPHLLPCFLLLSLAVLSGGCQRREGPELVRVSGVVTLDGKPLPSAVVRFEPVSNEKGSHSVAVTDDRGRYQLKYSRSQAGALVGEHLVRISTGDPGAVDANGNPTVIPELVPEIYHAKSTLTASVSENATEFDFKLVSKAR